MKILIVVHRYAPHPGGSESVCHWLAQELMKKGSAVHVATDEPIKDRTHFGVTVWGNKAEVNHEAYDWVMIHGRGIPHQDKWIRKTYNHAKLFFWPYLSVDQTVTNICMEGLSKADMVGCLTSTDWTLCMARAALKRAFVPWGVPEPRYYPKDRTQPNFVAVGGFWPHKRFAELVYAWDDHKMPWKLHLIGYHGKPNYKLPTNVEVHVNPSRREVLERIRNATCLMNNAEREGFGLTLLEAMSQETTFRSRYTGAAHDIAMKIGDPAMLYKDPQQLCRTWSQIDQFELCSKLYREGVVARHYYASYYTMEKCAERIIEGVF